MLTVLLAVSLLPTSASADLVRELDPSPPVRTDRDAFGCEGDIRWESPVSAGTIASQYDVCYPFDAEAAASFVGDGGDVVGFGWWGAEQAGVAPGAFRFTIYASAADGDVEVPGEMLFTETTSDVTRTPGSTASYCANLADVFSTLAGETYWLVVQAVSCFEEDGQWFRRYSTECTWGTYLRAEAFGTPDWELVNPHDAAFVVYYATDPVPLTTPRASVHTRRVTGGDTHARALGVACDEGVLVWEQLPSLTDGMSSQDDVCYPFTSEVADGFVGISGQIVAVEWWGGFWNGSPVPIDQFRIRLYQPDGECPGAPLADVLIDTYDAAEVEPGSTYYHYCASLPTPLVTGAVPYDISIQAVHCFPPQWGWVTSPLTPGQCGVEGEACFRSVFFDFEEWTPSGFVFGVSYDAAFSLYYDEDPIAVGDVGTTPDVEVAGPRPNPARIGSRVAIDVEGVHGLVDASIYDAAGRAIRRLAPVRVVDGGAVLTWDLTSRSGEPVPVGVYVVRIGGAGAVSARRLIVLR